MPTDLFGRTTSYGLDTDGTFTYVWVDRDTAFATAADSTLHVDGSQVVMPNDEQYDSYVLTGPTTPTTGTVSYDVFFPVCASSSDYLPSISFHIARLDQTPYWDPSSWLEIPFGFEGDSDFDPSVDAHVRFGSYDGSFNNAYTGDGTPIDPTGISLAIDTGNWYTIKCSYDMPRRRYAVKMWKRSDPEPTTYAHIVTTNDDWGYFTNGYGDGYDGASWIDFYFWSNVESYLDNLTYGAYEEIPYGFTARAFITSPAVATVTDTFTRSVSHGLGGGYAFVPQQTGTSFYPTGSPPLVTVSDEDYSGQFLYGRSSSYPDEADSPLSVNGSEGVLTISSDRRRSVYALPSIRPTAGYFQFDFKTPSANVGSNRIGMFVRKNGIPFSVVMQSTTVNTWSMIADVFGGTTVSLSLNTWYTAKCLYDGDTGETLNLVKAQGDPDASALATWSHVLSAITNGPTTDALWFMGALNGGDLKIDNVTWLEYGIGTRSASFTVDAFIGRQFTVNAYIVASNVAVFSDTFSRTTSYGLGSNYVFRPSGGPLGTFQSSFGTASSSLITVNGTEVVIPSETNSTRDAYTLPSQRVPQVGFFAFDFYIPVIASTNELAFAFPSIYFNFDDMPTPRGWGFAIVPSQGNDGVIAFGGYSPLYGGGLNTAYLPAVGAWYTLIATYDANVNTADVRIYDQSNHLIVEVPAGGQTVFGGSGYGALLSIIGGSTVSSWKIDNLRYSISSAASFTVDAYIRDPSTVPINAVIRRTRTGSLTIDAQFIQAIHSITANATIRAVRSASFTANAAVALRGFRIDAFINNNGVLQHYRDRDHTGTLLDTQVVLNETVGTWEKGLTLRQVLVDLWEQVQERIG